MSDRLIQQPPGDRFPGDWLRVYFLQNWYALSDPMAEETLYDSEAMRRFAGIELGDDRIPDEGSSRRVHIARAYVATLRARRRRLA